MSPQDEISPGDFFNALAAAGALGVFRALPEAAQTEFADWIEKARDSATHWSRIDTLVMAMRSAARLEAQPHAEPASKAQQQAIPDL